MWSHLMCVLVLCLVYGATGERCYVCSTVNDHEHQDSNCVDPVGNNVAVEECEPGENCVTIVGRGWNVWDEYGDAVFRHCAVTYGSGCSDSHFSDLPISLGIDGSEIVRFDGTTCVCRTDLCNGKDAFPPQEPRSHSAPLLHCTSLTVYLVCVMVAVLSLLL